MTIEPGSSRVMISQMMTIRFDDGDEIAIQGDRYASSRETRPARITGVVVTYRWSEYLKRWEPEWYGANVIVQQLRRDHTWGSSTTKSAWRYQKELNAVVTQGAPHTSPKVAW